MSDDQPTGHSYEIATIKDLFDVPAERREACCRQILLFLLTQELLFGEKAKEATKAIVWTDDGDNSVDVDLGKEGRFVLQVTKDSQPQAQEGGT